MYYGIVAVSVIMFGFQFFFSDRYEKENGNGFPAVYTLIFLSAIAGLVCLLPISAFKVGFTPFTLCCAAIVTLNTILCGLCTLKALARIDLAVFSLFSMLGGMVLPFLSGIIFYDERFTLGKVVCLVFVVAALLLTVDKSGKRGGERYYVGVFILNGMSGVISKFFESAPYPKTNAVSYSVWIAVVNLVVSGVALLLLRKKVNKPTGKAVLYGLGYGTLNRIANFPLVFALAVLPASVQYPFLTGGVIVVSTVISAFVSGKPKPKAIISVILAFVGIMSLVLLP